MSCVGFFGPIVYRLGHQVFILVRGVRLPLGLLYIKILGYTSGFLFIVFLLA